MRETYEAYEPACVRGNNFRVWKCPHGLAGLCDYGLQARFIHDAYPGEDVDAQATLAIYRQIALGEPAVEIVVSGEQKIKDAQLALYRPQQLGFVEEFILQYESLRRVRLHIRVEPRWTFAEGQRALRGSLEKLILSDRPTQLATIDRELATLAGTRLVGSAAQVEALLRLLLARIYRTIKSMRYQMLHTHWQYARIEPGQECRRGVLRRTFDATLRADEPCGHCDGCVPDMRFKGTRAFVPQSDTTLELLSRDLPEIFGRFDLVEVTRSVDVATDHRALGSLQGQAEYYLESDPASLAAYSVAGLAAHRRGRDEDALRHFTAGYVRNEAEARLPDRGRYFYEQARQVDPVRALDLPDRAGGLFDTIEGRKFVLGEYEKAGTPEAQVDLLRGSVACDEVERFGLESAPALLGATRSLLAELGI